MARSRSKTQPGRDAYSDITRRSLLRDILLRPHVVLLSRRILTEVEDRRRFHPARANRPVHSVSGRVSGRVVEGRTRGVRFASPRRLLVCLRRRMRKEVLHAFKKTGRGGGGRRKPRRNQLSSISCK